MIRFTTPTLHFYCPAWREKKYDFSKGERGKLFRTDAELRLPIYIHADVQAYLTERTAQKGIPLGELVNTLLKQEI
jgi:hypothetical protein